MAELPGKEVQPEQARLSRIEIVKPEYLGQDTEVRLLNLLAPSVGTKFFVDVGAEKGSIARVLSAQGLKGALIEPLQEHQAALRELAAEIGCAVHPIAIDEIDGERDLNVATGDDGKVLDYFHSLQRSEGSRQFHHETTRRVTCRSLASLTREGILPKGIGILKVDTDGHDLFVLRGLGDTRPELVVCEYFTQGIYAGLETGYPGPLIDLMHGYGYSRCLATKRFDEFELVQAAPFGFLPKQWGNLFFLSDALFAKAERALEKFIGDCEAGLLCQVHAISADRVAKEAVIVELQSALTNIRQSCEVLQQAALEKEVVIEQLDVAQGALSARVESLLANNREKQDEILSLRTNLEPANARRHNGQRFVEENAQHLRALLQTQVTHHQKIDDTVAALARTDECQREMLVEIQRLSAALAEKESTTLALLRRLREEGELRGGTLRALLNGQSGGSELVNRPAPVDVHASLIAALEEKERVIRGLSEAVDAYRAAHPLIAYVATPLRRISALRQKTLASLYALVRPRLGNLNQHPPIDLTLPAHYSRQAPPVNPPRISIVTPSFKQAAFVERTLRSVLDQNYPNLEYFVQDGGSQDGTVEILERYAGQLSGWESAQDGGQSHAINLGLNRTSGEIMAWLNSDDILLPGSLAYVANYFVAHPEVDVVYGHRILIDEGDRQIGRWILPAHDNDVLSWADFVPQETMFWRRRVWESVGGKVDETFRFAMDWDLLVRFRNSGARIVCLPRLLGGFRIHTQQKTSANISDIGFKEMDRIRQREIGRLPSGVEINAAIASYLFRHIFADLAWRFRK